MMKRMMLPAGLIAAVVVLGATGDEGTCDELQAVSQPQRVRVEPSKVRMAKSFRDLLKPGQWATLYRFPQGSPGAYRDQIRILTEEQKSRSAKGVTPYRKTLDDYRQRDGELQSLIRKESDTVKRAELHSARDELKDSFSLKRPPSDIDLGGFLRISEVGRDYVGFERDGVETFHRLSSIRVILRGVKTEQ